MIEIDKLKVLGGGDINLNDKISIKNPTIHQIKEMGEKKYFSVISTLTSIPSDFKSELDDSGIDYEEIDEFEFFIGTCKNLPLEDTRIILGDLDLSNMGPFMNRENGQIFLSEQSNFLDEVKKIGISEIKEFIDNFFDFPNDDNKKKIKELIMKFKKGKITEQQFIEFCDPDLIKTSYPKKDGAVIDLYMYIKLMQYIEEMHGFKPRKERREIAGNATTKRMLIIEDREKKEMSKRKPYQSVLESLIIALVNCSEFPYDYDTVMNVTFSNFMRSVRQIQRYNKFYFTMHGIYSGTIDTKKTKGLKKDLDWLSPENISKK